jgi:hypothetical protein
MIEAKILSQINLNELLSESQKRNIKKPKKKSKMNKVNMYRKLY